MLIQCTKKLLGELGLKPCAVTVENTLCAWHANLITINRRKAVILVNDASRYCVLLFGLKAMHFKKLSSIIVGAIEETLIEEGIAAEIVKKYLASGEIKYAKTSNKSVMAAMNQLAGVAECYQNEELDMENINQLDFNLRMGGWFCKIDGEYVHAKEVLIKSLEKFVGAEGELNGKSVVSIRAFQFLITLELQNYQVWRRVIVPANISFKKMHFVIQAAFGWQGYHLHNFFIGEENRPTALIVCSEEIMYDDYDEGYPVMLDHNTKLQKYFPELSIVKYAYDFGDNWQHTLELEEVIENYPDRRPVCLAGEGNCPPEDVGGEGGYEEFLAAISDANHPEHSEMVEWGKMQKYREFDLRWINMCLDSSIHRRN